MARESTCSLPIKITVRCEGAVAGQAYLSPVRMPCENEIDAIGRHCVEHAQIWCVRHPNGRYRIQIDCTGNLAVIVASNVRIVDTAKVHAHAFERDR